MVHDIIYGSPLGNPPPLSTIFLPPNLTSAYIHPKLIDQELLAEVSTNCMSGPFTLKEALIFGGSFCSSPVSLMEKVSGDGNWQIIRHLCEHDSKGHSTNDWLDSDEFPTSYFMALWVSQFVHMNVIFMLAHSHLLVP